MNDINQGKKNQEHNSLLTLAIGLVVAIGRINLDEKHTDDLVTIMAVVNIVAFGFVIALMLNDIYNITKNRIINSGVSTESKKIKKILLEILFFISFGIFGFYGVRYIIQYCNVKYNDAISILALTCSIATDGFVKLVEKPIYKIVCLLEKIYLHIKKLCVHLKLRCFKK